MREAELPPLNTVSSVDLSRYVGTWHQIAFFPTHFQKNCTLDTTAIYTLRDDGKLGVRNECTRDNGKRFSIEGTARVIDAATNAKLKVKFFWFLPAGDYWIIDLDADYGYAVVGTPDRKYLWILARTPKLSASVYEAIIKRVRGQFFDVSRLQVTGEIEQDVSGSFKNEGR